MTEKVTRDTDGSKRIALIAILIASAIVLQRVLSLRTPIISINFVFALIALAGILLGWKAAIIVSVVSDLIGALILPSGPFFIGYTLTAFLSGLASGLLLYTPGKIVINRKFILRLTIFVLITTGVFQGGLNTLWIMITTGGASNIIVPLRIVKQLIMAPIEFVTIIAIIKVFGRRLENLR